MTAPETAPVIEDDFVTLHGGDCLDVLRSMPDNSIDAVVTDPPYGLGNTTGAQVAETVTRWVQGDREFIPEGRGFMGRPWDAFVPPVAVWDECLRVLKPGGHLVAFSGSRTLDLMQLAIRLAGFDVRDTLMWLYGSGFPKGGNYDKPMAAWLAGVPDSTAIPQDVYAVTAYLKAARDAAGWSNRQIDALFGRNGMAGHWVSSGTQPAVPSLDEWDRLKVELAPHLGDDVDTLVAKYAATNRPEDWGANAGGGSFLDTLGKEYTPGVTEWSAALKPAHEPIVLARKPVVSTTTRTVQAYGTGALHVGACRIERDDVSDLEGVGRFPLNVILDDEAAAVLDERTPGQVSRFFYTAKASGRDRVKVDGQGHPTVKPLDLMQWLVRLVVPAGGVVLDPFAGSGTTLEAAIHEGFRTVGVERDPEYLRIIEARLDRPIARALDLGALA